MTKLIPFAALSIATAALAQQAPPDPATLYELSASMGAPKICAGQPATLVIAVKAKPGNHISEEAPLRIELSGVNAIPVKAALKLSDSLVKKEHGKEITEVRFEVPYTTAQPGSAQADARAIVFVCTENLCLRDKKDLSVPFEVTAPAQAPAAPPAKKKMAKSASTSKPL